MRKRLSSIAFGICAVLISVNSVQAQLVEVEITGTFAAGGATGDPVGLAGEVFTLSFAFADDTVATAGQFSSVDFVSQSSTLQVLGETLSGGAATFEFNSSFTGNNEVAITDFEFDFGTAGVLEAGSTFQPLFVGVGDSPTIPTAGVTVISNSFLDGALITDNNSFFFELGFPDAFIQIEDGTGSVTVTGGNATVPEPGSIALLAIGSLVGLRRRRR